MTHAQQVISTELNTYLAFLHDVIAAYHERLSETTSPKVASLFLASIADKESRNLGLDKEANPKKNVERLLENLGMKYESVKIGETTVDKLVCPFANVVHQRISATHPICPISVLALAAERIPGKRMVIASNQLTDTGAEYTIAPVKLI